jgi:hypothetical protein
LPQAIGKTKILKVINTMGKALLFEYVFRYYFQQLQYEIVWVKEINIDKTQRKKQFMPWARPPIVFFLSKLSSNAALT